MEVILPFGKASESIFIIRHDNLVLYTINLLTIYKDINTNESLLCRELNDKEHKQKIYPNIENQILNDEDQKTMNPDEFKEQELSSQSTTTRLFHGNTILAPMTFTYCKDFHKFSKNYIDFLQMRGR